MAGDDGANPRDSMDYPYDDTKYKGFWRYYNSETPHGRVYGSMINLGTLACIGIGIYLYKKFQKRAVKEK